MAFKMHCPKCNSNSLFLEEDQKAFVGGGRHQVQLHCYMCGKVIYGQEAIEAEYNKQMAVWAETHQSEAPAATAQARDESGTETPEEASPGTETQTAASSGQPECAWAECDKPARLRSKYCSRNCSNKNARSRYSRRSNTTEAA